MFKRLIIVLILALGALQHAAAAGSQPGSQLGLQPDEHGVLDRAEVLQSHVQRDAETQLAQLERSAGLRVALLLVNGLADAETLGPAQAAKKLFAAWQPAGHAQRLLILIDAAGRGLAILPSDDLKTRFPAAALEELAQSLSEDSLKVGDLNSTVTDVVKGLVRIAERTQAAAAAPSGAAASEKVQRAPDGRVAVPALTGPVTDLTATLTPADKAALEQRLHTLEAQTRAQLAVLLVPTTAPEAIEQYALRVAEAWRLGQENLDNGVLLLVAKDDRKLRIEVGYGLEGALNDATAKRIIDERIAPRFKQQDYVGGLLAGVEAMAPILQAEPMPAGPARAQEPPFDLSTTLAFWIAVSVGLILNLVLRQGRPAAQAAPVAAAVSAALGGGLGLFLGGPVLGLFAGLPVFLAAFLPMIPPAPNQGRRSQVPDLAWPSPDTWSAPSGSSTGGGAGQSYSGGGGKFGGGGASGGW